MTDLEIFNKELQDAKEVKLENKTTQEIKMEKKRNKILNTLNSDFIDKLEKKVLFSQNIKAQDIIDIVYQDEKNPYFRVSTTKICEVIGVSLLKTNDTNLEGSISFNSNDKLEIKYLNHGNKQKSRFTVFHELGHLFKHLITGIEAKHKDQNKVQVEQEELLAARGQAISNNNQRKIEIEADIFAGELIIPNKSFEYIQTKARENKEQYTSSAMSSFFDISPWAFYNTIKNKGIDINKDSDFIINDTRPW